MVLLPLPPKILNVIDLVLAEQPTRRFDELKWKASSGASVDRDTRQYDSCRSVAPLSAAATTGLYDTGTPLRSLPPYPPPLTILASPHGEAASSVRLPRCPVGAHGSYR